MDTSFLFKVSLGHCPVRMRWDNEKNYAVLRLRRGHAPNPRAGTSATICSTRALSTAHHPAAANRSKDLGVHHMLTTTTDTASWARPVTRLSKDMQATGHWCSGADVTSVEHILAGANVPR